MKNPLLPTLLSLLALPAAAGDLPAPVVAPAPTPVREMSTDRPDTTESATTVPKGMFQIEAELGNVTLNSGDYDGMVLGEVLFKYGLTDRLDLEVNVPSYSEARQEDGSLADGFGDLTFRVKFNVWGNDEGASALALLPFVSAPTGADGVGADRWQYGLTIPYALDLTDRFGLGLQTQAAAVSGEDGHEFEWIHSAVLGVAVTDRIGVFVEGVLVNLPESDWNADVFLNTGFTYAFTADSQLDGGVRLGLDGEVDDATLFLGYSVRF